MIARLFRRHAHWSESANAYIDGELGPSELARFETHMGQCARCRETVGAARATKALLDAMPAVHAPRSFALTPALLAEPAQPSRTHGRPVALRLAQGVAVLAVVALAAVVTMDMTSGGANSNQTLASPQESVAGSANAAAVPSPAAEASPTSAIDGVAATPPTTVPIVPPPHTGAGAQGYSPSPSPTASPTVVPTVGGESSPAPQARDAAGAQTFGAQGAGGEAKRAASREQPRKANVAAGWYRPAEIALAAAAAVAGIAALVLAVRRRV
jgi:hypothetical protein